MTGKTRDNSADIQGLVTANFACRDELYRAAESLEGDRRGEVCRTLAQRVAGHAACLQQLLLRRGEEPGELPDERGVADKFRQAAKSGGADSVLDVAAHGLRTLQQRYDLAQDLAREDADDEAATTLLSRRSELGFATQVLRSLRGDAGPAAQRRTAENSRLERPHAPQRRAAAAKRRGQRKRTAGAAEQASAAASTC